MTEPQPGTPAAPERDLARPDGSTVRLALVVGGLVLAVLLGFGLGRINGDGSPAAAGLDSALADHTHAPGTGAHEHGADQSAAAEAAGLAVTASGYTLTPLGGEFTAGREGELRFQVRDAQRRAVTRFAVVHEKPMHLIVVRRDLSGYQHLHPSMAADGTWSVPLTLPRAGVWRAYADFTAVADDGRQVPVTLGTDLVAPGEYAPRPLPAPAASATVDGFTVGVEGTPQAGLTVPLTFRITAPGGGTPALERYLGAYGHLVALREGDLGYLHVHPEPELVDGAVRFWLTTPGPGRYRLYLDFQVAGEVRTAEFTVTVL
ncbi:hypothetical protein GA0070609_6590 [Micromonospora echinaurantiaca]|uniref:Secreted protein n=1 Tax=Micromonospora echinaurantiaca TaxID=47857 RepID=A0A1C5KE93_9ACTN|nr:hypothetical protein [Micromonospora echinaurantiaca]SCG80696.1 hypothetical protein GA0070609_6590 [Micromonospora echinaurantiaca]